MPYKHEIKIKAASDIARIKENIFLNLELNLQHSVKEIKTPGMFQPYWFSCCYDAM